MKHLIGITSYGNLSFLKLALEADKKTLTREADIIVVVAKPGDAEMIQFLTENGYAFIVNEVNKGLAGSVNDIFEHGWFKNDYDTITIQGNDVIPYPGALDAMINCAETTDWEWVAATQFDSKTLVAMYPEVQSYFQGDKLVFSDFDSRPWEIHKDLHAPMIEPDAMKDVRNLALFKRSVFDKIGYCDVNFAYNSYFEDNDAVARALRTDVRACGLREAVYFHFWSRTYHQGDGRPNNVFFDRNRQHFLNKWGGMPGQETKTPELKIADRSGEEAAITYWNSL